jgi:mRNA interferase YafQ
MKIYRTNQFKRSFKKLNLSDSDFDNFVDVIYKIKNGIKLDEKYRDHNLSGNLSDFKECHLKPDLLLIYKIKEDFLHLVDIGSHSELFK